MCPIKPQAPCSHQPMLSEKTTGADFGDRKNKKNDNLNVIRERIELKKILPLHAY